MSRYCRYGLALLLMLLTLNSAEAAKNKKKDKAAAADESQQLSDDAKPAEEKGDKASSKKEDPAQNAAAKKPAVAEPTSATYFGILTQGKRFVYVVDNSNSMTNGRFDTACYELMSSVDGLAESQQFYVIFFSDTAYPLFYPNAAKTWVPATKQNKDRLRKWLGTVQLALHTKAQAAMMQALAVKPDAVFLLTDGAFTDGTMAYLLEQPKGKTKIHTLGMQVSKGGAEANLKQIAEHFDGTYKEVEVTPQFKGVSRQKNTKSNGVWGVTLGQGKAGKKPKK
jgi:hypothetical protein